MALHFDPLVSFVICGAASLVGSGMLLVVRPDESRLREALQTAVLSFAGIGLSLVQLLWTAPDLPPWSSALMLLGTHVSMAAFAVAVARLSGQEAITPARVTFLTSLGVAALGAAFGSGGLWPGTVYTLCGIGTSGLLVAASWPFLRHPRNPAEWVLGWAAVAFLASWLLRTVLMLGYEGPRLPHELYLPTLLQPLFALLYATLPVMMAALVLTVINARLQEQLASRALTDELTGMLMRRAVRERAPAALARARSAGRLGTVLMIDIDRFKHINDSRGHAAGDEVLRQVASVLRSQLRPDALVGRFGGEEFIVVVDVQDVAAARAIAERLRAAVAAAPCPLPSGEVIDVTVSVGVAMLGEGETLDQGLLRADEAMYRAKNGGRDRVEVGLSAAA